MQMILYRRIAYKALITHEVGKIIRKIIGVCEGLRSMMTRSEVDWAHLKITTMCMNDRAGSSRPWWKRPAREEWADDSSGRLAAMS